MRFSTFAILLIAVGSVNGQPALPATTLNYTLTGTEAVTSVLSFNNDLFVTRGTYKANNQIQVYDNSNFQFVRNITIPPIDSPWTGTLFGLAISSDGSVLYVSDLSNGRIYTINLATSTLTSTWRVVCNPCELSINSAGNILVAGGSYMKIQEYTPSGSLVKETHTTSYPWHALELSSGSLLVSRTSPANDVCVMSIDGTVSACYGSTAGSGPGQLNWPRSMALDAHGYVLVADYNNNRVMILDPSLSQGVPLPLPDDFTEPLSGPSALWFDKSRARLYVGEYAGSYRVLVFDNIKLCVYFD